jgi:hypothetical protein
MINKNLALSNVSNIRGQFLKWIFVPTGKVGTYIPTREIGAGTTIP